LLGEIGSEVGGVASRRQQLPDAAFVPFERVIRATQEQLDESFAELPIAALSYMWLDPAHPDPQGDTLRLLASHLKKQTKFKAIFWDYMSLYQHYNGGERTTEETRLFKQGLEAMPELYSHPRISVLRVKEFPPNNAGTSQVGYDQRGWPFAESSWAGLAPKGLNLLTDLRHGESGFRLEDHPSREHMSPFSRTP